MTTLKEALSKLRDMRAERHAARPLAGEAAADLLPCPFCGGEAEYDNSDDGPYEWIACTECGARGPTNNYNSNGLGGCLEAWNRRPQEDAAALEAASVAAEACRYPTSGP
jgi:Lar family restriction alleviation protein